MGWFGILYWLLFRRLRSSWPLLAITSFGILAAVTLMAVGAIYSRGVAEGGVRHTLATADPAVLDAQVIVQDRPLGLADYLELRDEIEQIAQLRVGHITRDVQRFGRTQSNWALIPNSDDPFPAHLSNLNLPLSIVGRPFFLTGFEEHSRLVEGKWPQPTPVVDAGALRLEAVVGTGTASSYPLTVGSQVSLFPFRSDGTERVVITVVGLAQAIDPREEYWLNTPTYFNVEQRGGEQQQLVVPFYVPEGAFFDSLGSKYPAAAGDFGWLLFFDTRLVTAGTAGLTKDALIGLETDINKRFPRTFVFTGLKNRLTDYQKRLTLARVPLYLFIGLVVLVILYFLALVMGLLTRYRAEEASLLRSRGASVFQVSCFLVAAEGVVTLIAMAAGPFLALAIVRYLLLNTLDPVGVDEVGLSVGLSADMFVMGAVGGLSSLAVLAAYCVSRARQGVAASLSQRARPPTIPFLHRYYIDLLVLAALGVLWWQIGGRGGFVSRDVTSRALEVDPSLLFGPVMVLLAAVVLTLRFLPWIVRLLAWSTSRVSSAWANLSLVRLARDPLPHGSLVIILMLAAAVGVFGASFQSTLSRSQREQALYQQGGDFVLRGTDFKHSTQDVLAATQGVAAVSPMARDFVVLLDSLSSGGSSLIRFDPDTLPQISWFRDDFADKSLAELLAPLRRAQPNALDPASGVIIPTGGERIGLWVNVAEVQPGTDQQSLNLWARILDSAGRHHNLLLGDLLNPPALPPEASKVERPSNSSGSSDGWVYVEAAMPGDERQQGLQFALVSLFLSKRYITVVHRGSISLDDLTVKGPSFPTMGSVIEDFEEPGTWLAVPSQVEPLDTVEYLTEAARTGTGGFRYSWQTPISGAVRGIFLPPGPYPLPAIGSGVFQIGQVFRVTDGKQVVSVSIQDVTDYFPTANPSFRPFLLVAEEDYRQLVERLFQGRLDPPAQMWVSPAPGTDRQQVISLLTEQVSGFVSVKDRKAIVELAERDPLAGGGWNGLTILALSTITVAVVLTLAIHGLVAVRTGRVDLTVARALGFSNMQVMLAMALERVLVAALGIGIGAAIGIFLGRWVLGFLDITTRGQTVIPPMVIDVQIWLVGLVLGCLAAATILSLILAALWARRLKVPEVLRAAE